MPDILIRGMEMPKNCGGCYLNHGEFCFMLCRKLNIPQEWEARPSNCPLVELPPHGDLIDRDSFREENEYYLHREFINPKYEDTLDDLLKDAPVIVLASEESNHDES